jgi:DNA gyrase subunit A
MPKPSSKPPAEPQKIENGNGNGNSRIITQVIEDEMKSAYLAYSMSVIIGRALPDARDGLKPVHQRILYAMYDLGVRHNSPYKKSARIVGDVMGKYHPHGDMAIYDTLVRMAQDFSLRYPLIQGQGNFGSIDGDSPAAQRYTEARLAKISDEMLQDLDKETVPFRENYDGQLKEPTVLPSKIPNLLINGSQGIAVGMATSIPPHNLKEVCNAVKALIKNNDITIQELAGIITGPDFPTGGIIVGNAGIMHAYATGRGKLTVRARMHHETTKQRTSIIITEIPYLVLKNQLIEEIAEQVKEKRIEGISDIRDESDRTGMRVVIELKQSASMEIVQNQLYKHSRLQDTFPITLLAIVENKPKTLTLKDALDVFLHHRQTVVRKRTEFDIAKAKARAHILEGLLTALSHIDAVVKLIKESRAVADAHQKLKTTYQLSDEQTSAILEMRLSKLASLEQEAIKNEHTELQKLISKLAKILADEKEILKIIDEEMDYLIKEYGDERKTTIEAGNGDDELDDEDLIPKEDVVIMISHAGYAKRLSPEEFKTQNRGGKGVIGAGTKEQDAVRDAILASTHDYLLSFTDKGLVHWTKAYKIPEAGRTSAGRNLINIIGLSEKERVTNIIPVHDFTKGYLFMATKRGIVKKTLLEEFSRPRQGGIKAILIEEGDELIDVRITDGQRNILIATKKGNAAKFREEDVRSMGRATYGVRGIRLKKDDEVIGMVIESPNETLLTITENGYGKRTAYEEYRLIGRGGQGVRNILCSPRNGNVVSIISVHESDEFLTMTERGSAIRMRADQVNVIGRNTQGVRVMKLDPGDKVTACTRIPQDVAKT